MVAELGGFLFHVFDLLFFVLLFVLGHVYLSYSTLYFNIRYTTRAMACAVATVACRFPCAPESAYTSPQRHCPIFSPMCSHTCTAPHLPWRAEPGTQCGASSKRLPCAVLRLQGFVLQYFPARDLVLRRQLPATNRNSSLSETCLHV